MIKAIRVTVPGGMSFEGVDILEPHETSPVPNYFEDSNFVFKCKEGVFSLPYYNVSMIQLNKIFNANIDGVKVPLITISSQCPFKDVTIVPPESYAKYGIPVLFPVADQFAFQARDGIYISSDYQVELVAHVRKF